jgi:hypothetical protein
LKSLALLNRAERVASDSKPVYAKRAHPGPLGFFLLNRLAAGETGRADSEGLDYAGARLVSARTRKRADARKQKTRSRRVFRHAFPVPGNAAQA